MRRLKWLLGTVVLAQVACGSPESSGSGGACDGGGALKTFYRDSDTDGFGDPAGTLEKCTAPAGYVDNDLDCDDAVQETFLACLTGPAFRGESSFRTYLFAIARNVLHAQMKRLGRARAEVDVGEISVMDLGPSPSTLAARRREERLLLSALRAIPLDMQIALELFYWEDLSGSELAVALEIPEGTVRSRLRRAREALDQKSPRTTRCTSLSRIQHTD